MSELVDNTERVLKKRRSRGSSSSGGGGDVDINDDDDDHALHLWTERERRKKMKDMFSNLHQLLPHIPLKADKSTIVDEAVSYIQNLQVILEEFQRMKLERIQTNNDMSAAAAAAAGGQNNFMLSNSSSSSNSSINTHNHLPPPPPVPVFETWTWPNVVLNVCGEQGQFSVCALKKPNLSSSIFFFFENHNLDLLYCNLISNQSWSIYIIQAQVRKEVPIISATTISTTTTTTSDHHDNIEFPAPSTPPVEIFKRAATDITSWLSNSNSNCSVSTSASAS